MSRYLAVSKATIAVNLQLRLTAYLDCMHGSEVHVFRHRSKPARLLECASNS